MKKLVLIVVLIAALCIVNYRDPLRNVHRIGILANTQDKVDIVFFAKTLLTSPLSTLPMPELVSDELIEHEITAYFEGKYAITDLSDLRAQINERFYTANHHSQKGRYKMEGVIETLAKAGAARKLDAVILIISRGGDYDATNGHVINFIGPEELHAVSNFEAFVIDVKSHRIISHYDSNDINGGPGARQHVFIAPSLLPLWNQYPVTELSQQQRLEIINATHDNIRMVTPMLMDTLLDPAWF